MHKICSILALNLLFCPPLIAAEDYPVGDTPCRRYVAEGRDGQRMTFYLSTQQERSHPYGAMPVGRSSRCSGLFANRCAVGHDRV